MWPPLGPQGCASWARNPKGPQITPFCHQLGRHPTVLHIRGGVRCRISARISPDRSHPLNLDFFLDHLWTTNCQNRDFGKKKTPLRGISQQSLATWIGKTPPWGGPGGPWGGPGGPGAPGPCALVAIFVFLCRFGAREGSQWVRNGSLRRSTMGKAKRKGKYGPQGPLGPPGLFL